MMSLEDAVELVLFAFENGNPGDLFVNKAPASTISNLANALKKIFNSKTKISEIGIRHGEKIYETLCTSEEMMKAEDMGNFYRIPADNRDLNYSKYISKGKQTDLISQDYNSHNTHRLDLDEMIELLMKLPYLKEYIN